MQLLSQLAGMIDRAFQVSFDQLACVTVDSVSRVVSWCGQFSMLAAFFAKRAPERITLKSLYEIRHFCAVLFCCLSLIALVLAR